jgi:DNA-binding transcriptional ArsR family regulator
MARSARDRKKLEAQALSHPLRLRLLEIHQRVRGKGWPLPVDDLAAALEATGEFGDVTAPKVNYHLRRLQDAGLLST